MCSMRIKGVLVKFEKFGTLSIHVYFMDTPIVLPMYFYNKNLDLLIEELETFFVLLLIVSIKTIYYTLSFVRLKLDFT